MSEYNSKEWLHENYAVKGLSTGDIAKIANVNQKTVHKWLRKYGIPTRPRGHNYASNPKFAFWVYGQESPSVGFKHTEESKRKMSESSKGPSPWLRGSVHHMYGKTGPQSRTWKGGVTPERQAFNGTIAWRRAVEFVQERDSGACQRCGKHQEDARRKFDIHHIADFFEAPELRACPENLVLLCHACHMWVHSAANVEKVFIKELTK